MCFLCDNRVIKLQSVKFHDMLAIVCHECDELVGNVVIAVNREGSIADGLCGVDCTWFNKKNQSSIT